MSAPFYGLSHIETLENLPPNLERGRAYFIDDEGYIVIDHGRGPVVYGNRPGPAGEAGEPIPELNEKINYLTQAIFNILAEIVRMSKSYDTAINILAQSIANLYPESHSSEWKDPENTTANILTTEDGTQYTITNARVEDGFYIFELEPDEETAAYLAQTLRAGDTVNIDNSEWEVIHASTGNGILTIELGQ